MSEVMTRAILGMPLDMAMDGELSRMQFHARAQALLADYDRLVQECERQSVITGDYIAQFQRMRAERDAVLKQVEELRADAERASYWKQRAKSAEGHLMRSDFDHAAKALHKRTVFAAVPWEELTDAQKCQIQFAVFEVIGAVNRRRDSRMPLDAALQAKP